MATTEAPAVTPPPLFGTVVISRTPQESPSPLELQIRPKCSRVRIVDKPLRGGAHLLLPSSETIAVRAYFPSQECKDSELVDFRNAFKYTIVFFILPPAAQQQALSDMNSLVNRAQKIMNYWDDSKKSGTTKQIEGCGRVFIVPNVACAIKVLASIVDTLKPERRALKQNYYNVQSKKFFVVNSGQAPDPTIVSAHVANAFREWAQRFQLPAGEADILMSRFGSLSKIATADLNGFPALDDTSKAILTSFFGSNTQGQGVPLQEHSIPPTPSIGNNMPVENNFPSSSTNNMSLDSNGPQSSLDIPFYQEVPMTGVMTNANQGDGLDRLQAGGGPWDRPAAQPPFQQQQAPPMYQQQQQQAPSMYQQQQQAPPMYQQYESRPSTTNMYQRGGPNYGRSMPQTSGAPPLARFSRNGRRMGNRVLSPSAYANDWQGTYQG